LDLGASTFEVGLLGASFSAISVFTALPIGRLVDRRGSGGMVVVGLIGVASLSLACIWIEALPLLLLAYAGMGTALTSNLIAQQAMVANIGGRAARDVRFGWLSTAASVGQLAGPALGGILASQAIVGGTEFGLAGGNDQALVFLVASVTSFAGAAVGLSLVHVDRRPKESTTDRQGQPGMLRAARGLLRLPGMRRAMFVGIVVVSSIDVLMAYLPVYGEANGLPVSLVGLLLSVRAGATLASRAFMDVALERLGRGRLLTLGLGVASGSMLALAFVPAEPLILAVLMILFGLGVGVGQPITIAWVTDQAPRNERAMAIGLRLVGNRVALMTMPLLVAIVAGTAGLAVAFALVSTTLAAGATTAFTTKFTQRRAPTADPVDMSAADGAMSSPPAPVSREPP
jgi:MFS family permease